MLVVDDDEVQSQTKMVVDVSEQAANQRSPFNLASKNSEL
jgi:hypothetical protein